MNKNSTLSIQSDVTVIHALASKSKKTYMKHLFLLLLILVSIPSVAQQKTKILVLGSYHMANPGLDKFNMDADDVFSPKRQKEIEEFVTLLATFKPTKICLEFSADQNKNINEMYTSYLNGESELRKNEIDQVGFRLAKKLEHKEVYAIDAYAPFDMDTVVSFAQQHQFNDFLQLLETIPAFMEDESKKLKESTVTQFFTHINEPSYNQFAHNLYLNMAVIGKDKNYVGADLVADWYKRNLRIYRNLMQIPLSGEDRVLILFGAGHAKILQDLVSDSSNLELVQLSNLK